MEQSPLDGEGESCFWLDLIPISLTSTECLMGIGQIKMKGGEMLNVKHRRGFVHTRRYYIGFVTRYFGVSYNYGFSPRYGVFSPRKGHVLPLFFEFHKLLLWINP